MRRIVTARLGEEYGNREKLFDEISLIERVAKIGCVMRDTDRGPERNRAAIANRSLSFDARFARTIHDVYLVEDHIVFDTAAIFIDASIHSIDICNSEQAKVVANDFSRRLDDASLESKKVILVDGLTILASNEGSGTWGHWVIHNLPRVLAAAAAYQNARIAVPASYFGSRPNFGSLLSLFGISESRVIKTRPKELYRFDRLVIPDYLYSRNAVHPAALTLLSQTPSHIGVSNGTNSRKVLIKRATVGKREIVNETEFEARMMQSGFQPIELGSFPIERQISCWNNAKNVASVLGSDLTNIVFGSSDISVLAFTPNHFGDDFFFDLAAAKGCVWNELYCSAVGERKLPLINSSFLVDYSSLDSFLEQASFS